jgi:hypothetical protein
MPLITDTVTLTLGRPVANDLLLRLLESPHSENDVHECYLIALLADALGEDVSAWIRKRAAVFA